MKKCNKYFNFLFFIFNIFLFLNEWLISSTYAQEFPLSPTVPASSPDSGAWLSPFSLNAPAHLPSLSGWHAMFWSHEDLKSPSHPWNVSAETLWLAHEIPFFKAACFASCSSLRDGGGYFGGILGFGCGWAASPDWSFGVRFLNRRTPARPEQDDARDWAASVRFSPRENLSFTYQAESLFMHAVGGLPQERLHRLEFAWGRFSRIFAGVHLSERRRDLALSGGFRWRPLPGLSFTLSASWARRHDEAYAAGMPVRVETPQDFTVAAGLAFQLDSLAVAQAVTLPGPSLDTFVRLSSRTPEGDSLFPESDYVMFFDLSERVDEERHARFALAVRVCLQVRACRGVLLKLGEESPSWVQAEDWARWFGRLRAAGRRSFVYGASFGESDYALAAGADGVYIFPGGSVRLRGLSSHRFYLAQAFQNLGIGADFVMVGAYKSAPEMFMRRSPSAPAAEQEGKLLEARDRVFKTLVLQRRGLTLEHLQRFQSRMEIDAESALAEGLVDAQLYADQVPAAVFRKLGAGVSVSNALNVRPEASRDEDFIALLVLEGEIVASRPLLPNPLTGMGFIELQKAASAVMAAAQDPRAKAIVLRISSPGGSAAASEALWRVVELASRRKPVVVSVGDMAASGGYYVAVGARRIVAGNGSWIGSIGVFGGKFQAEALLQRLGVGINTRRRAPMADAEAPWRPYTPEERESLRRSLETTYRRFVETVARGRKLTSAAAQRRADGRVMSGFAALREGLVDDVGSLLDALAIAAREAGMPEHSPVALLYPPPDPAWKNLVRKALSEMNASAPGVFVFSSLFLPGPWMLWPEMPGGR